MKQATIAACDGFTCAEGHDIVISIDDEPEGTAFCSDVVPRPESLQASHSAMNAASVASQSTGGDAVARIFARHHSAERVNRATTTKLACGQVDSGAASTAYPQQRTQTMARQGRSVDGPASLSGVERRADPFASKTSLDAQGDAMRAECGAAAAEKAMQPSGRALDGNPAAQACDHEIGRLHQV